MEPITLVKNAVQRPDEPRHFMEYKFPDDTYVATIDERELARSSKVLRLFEVGYAIYEPVVYFPRSDVNLALLRQTEKSSHCPLKGDTAYYDLLNASADNERELAWQYDKPLDFAQTLKDYIAFDLRKVELVKL